VTAGQTTGGVNIVMATGAVLHINVDDPLTLLSPVSGPVDLNMEIHLVTARGLHYSALIQSRTPTGREYAITVPFSAALALRILRAHLIVNNQPGTPVPTAGLAVNLPSGGTPQTIQLTVGGTK